jgi:replicative DNA helicase
MNLEHLTCEPEERAVVGACISFEAAHCLNLLTVDPKMLYDQQLGDLLGAAIELHRKDRQVTTQAVARHLADGGAPFADMFRLAISVEGDACTKYSFDALSGIVMNRYARRQAYAAMRRSMAALEAGEDDDATSATSDAVAALSGVHSARDEPTIIAAAAEKAFLTAEDARKNGRKPGIQISLRLWNEAMGGLKAPRLIVIGARPGMGLPRIPGSAPRRLTKPPTLSTKRRNSQPLSTTSRASRSTSMTAPASRCVTLKREPVG